MLRGLGISPFLPVEGSHADQRRRRERTGFQEFSARKSFNDEVVLFCVHNLATPLPSACGARHPCQGG
jgi:hypothetical protein